MREANVRLLKQLHALRKTFSLIGTTQEDDSAISRIEAEHKISSIFAEDHVIASASFFDERKAIIKSKFYGREADAETRQAARRDVVLRVVAEIKEFQNA